MQNAEARGGGEHALHRDLPRDIWRRVTVAQEPWAKRYISILKLIVFNGTYSKLTVSLSILDTEGRGANCLAVDWGS